MKAMKTFTEDVLIEGLEMGIPIVRQLVKKERDAEWLAALDEMQSQINDALWQSMDMNEGPEARKGMQAQRRILNELKTRMEAKE